MGRIGGAVAGRQFHHANGMPVPRPASGRHCVDALHYTSIAVDKKHVDCISQTDGMHPLARGQHQAGVPRQARPGMQATQPLPDCCCRIQSQGGNGGQKSVPISLMAMGKPMTRNVQGKIQKTMGNSIFTGASKASFSARRKRSARRCSDCARSNGPRLIPS